MTKNTPKKITKEDKEVGYKDNLKLWRKAYAEIEKVCAKYPDFYEKFGFDDIRDMQSSAKNHLLLIEWYEKYGLKINHEHQPLRNNYFRVYDYMIFNYFKDAEQDKSNHSGKYISWSDDGKQPKDEWLIEISFPTGAYIFGDDYNYQQEIFQEFYKELETYKPKYKDSHNHCLYFSLDNGKAIYENFFQILEKYQKKNREEFKKREIQKTEKKLAELKESL